MRLVTVLCVLGSLLSVPVSLAARQDHHGSRDNVNQKYRFSTVPIARTCRLWSPPVSCW